MQAPYSRTAFELLCEQASIAPDRMAAITVDDEVSYGELTSRASCLAAELRRRGIRRGDRIGLLSNNRIAWLEIFFAAAALGTVIVPFSTWSTANELEYVINDSRVRWLFAIEQFGDQAFIENVTSLTTAGRTPQLETIVAIDGDHRPNVVNYTDLVTTENLSQLPPGEGPSAGDAIFILYTYGSSSRPKAVPLDQFATIENAFNIGQRQGLRPGDRVLVSIPLFWAYGAVNALPAIISHGATLVMQSHFEAGGALDLIEAHACTGIYTLPAMTNALVAHSDFRPQRTASLRTGVTIGAPQDIYKAVNELGVTSLSNVYGGTEHYGNCCVTPHDWPQERRASCQGPPLPGVRLRIRDGESGALLPAGEIGEIEVSGYLTKGYDGDSAQFNASSFATDGYFRTGDLGSLDEDGALHFAGRSSEMIKRSGINVSPAEVEDALQRHPDIALAGVTGVEDADRGELIFAFITAKPGHDVDKGSVVSHCRELLSRYKVPDQLVVANQLPLTVTGKLMRRELKDLAVKAVNADTPHQPQSQSNSEQ